MKMNPLASQCLLVYSRDADERDVVQIVVAKTVLHQHL